MYLSKTLPYTAGTYTMNRFTPNLGVRSIRISATRVVRSSGEVIEDHGFNEFFLLIPNAKELHQYLQSLS